MSVPNEEELVVSMCVHTYNDGGAGAAAPVLYPASWRRLTCHKFAGAAVLGANADCGIVRPTGLLGAPAG